MLVEEHVVKLQIQVIVVGGGSSTKQKRMFCAKAIHDFGLVELAQFGTAA